MRKLSFTVAALAVCAVSLVAEEVSVTPASTNVSFSTGYVLDKFPGTSVEDGWLRGARGVVQSSQLSSDERRMWGGLGNSRDIDTATELLAMASVLGIQDVKKEDALKLYAEIAMEGATNSFFGVTGTTHEQVLARLRGKYNFTQTEIAGAIRATIAEAVTEKLNEKRDGYIPAEVYAQWKKIGAGDAQALMVEAITRFYLEPSQTTFRKLVEIYARQYHLSVNGDLFSRTGEDTFTSILLTLNASLKEKVVLTGLGLNVEVATLDPRYSVFSTPYGVGGGQ